MTELRSLGKYEIVDVLGRGAMGMVYKGWDPGIRRHVALKTIRRDVIEQEQLQDYIARFTNEAQAGGRMSHSGIVAVYEYGEDAGVSYIAMEYVAGRGLRDYLSRHERFGLHETMRIMGQLLDALSYAHECGVIHRDIKPANLIITLEGKLKLADFGIARIDNTNLTHAGTILGTPNYMSPEQFSGLPVDARTDIFSAGVVLYELLTGMRPFEGPTETIAYKVCHEPHRNPSEVRPDMVPPEFDAVVARALAKEREGRYRVAADFGAALLDAYQRRSATAGSETTVLNPPQAGAPRHEPTYPPSIWPIEQLRALETLLAPSMGPMARLLVKRAAASAVDARQLVQSLAQDVTDVAARNAFIAAAREKVGVSFEAASSGPRPGTDPRRAVACALSPEELQKAESALTAYVGPIAHILVRRAAARGGEKQAFYSEVSEAIASEADRARFLDDCVRR
jgi:serine/threonine protein kinase